MVGHDTDLADVQPVRLHVNPGVRDRAPAGKRLIHPRPTRRSSYRGVLAGRCGGESVEATLNPSTHAPQQWEFH